MFRANTVDVADLEWRIFYIGSVALGSARHLYKASIYSVTYLQIKIFLPSDCSIFSPGSEISIVMYAESKLMLKIERFSAKRMRCLV